MLFLLTYRPYFHVDIDVQISSWLIDDSKKKDSLEKDRFWLNGDSVALIVAGRQVTRTES